MPDYKVKLALFASRSLSLGGAILMPMGAYFVFLRPPLLPEDLEFINSSAAPIQGDLPGLLRWLKYVFGVLGGFMFTAGLLTSYIAATSRSGVTYQFTMIVAVSGLASIGWMAITNFLIASDFKWLLLLFTFPWLVAVLLYSVSLRRSAPFRR